MALSSEVRKWLIPRIPDERLPLEVAGIAPGVYHYLRAAEGAYTRFHLRVDPSGDGLLLAGAAAAARLRPSGVIIAKGLLEGQSPEAIDRTLAASFRGADRAQRTADLEQMAALIAALAAPGDTYPILNVADPVFTPGATPLDRPLSADLPLAEAARLVPLLDRLWDLGIPHAVFLVGEEFNPADLVRAVERGEDLGMITGARLRAGQLLGRPSLVGELAQAGIDHIDLLCLSADAAIHDGLAGPGDHAALRPALAAIHAAEVCPVALLPLLPATVATLEATLDLLQAAGVGTAGCFALATEDEAAQALAPAALVTAAALIEELADERDLRLLWYPPVRFHPAEDLVAQVRRGAWASGDTSVRIEPDGRVLLARGKPAPVGNLRTDSWEAIRDHELYCQYRARLADQRRCDGCPELVVCQAECPRDPAGWAG